MGSFNLWSVAKLKAAKSLSQLEEEEEGLLQASFRNLEREKMSYLLSALLPPPLSLPPPLKFPD